MNSLDIHLYHLVNQYAGRFPALDKLMIFFAQAGPFIYAILLIAAWFFLPKRDEKNRHALIMTVLSGVLALAINFIISHIWFRPRPFVALPKGSFHQLVPHSPDASFPSDHASLGFGLSSAAWGNTPAWMSVSFTVLAVLIMVARVFVGVHWPTDVLAGMVVGIISGRVIWLFAPLFKPVTNLGLRIFRFGPYARRPKTYS